MYSIYFLFKLSLILIIIFLFIDFIKKNYRKNEIGIALPVIGHLYKFIDEDRKNPHRLFSKLYSKYGSGGALKLWAGSHLLVVINDPKFAKDILIKNFPSFSDRFKLPSGKKFSNNFKGLAFSEFNVWSKYRTMVSPLLTKTKVISSYSNLIEKNTQEIISSIINEKQGIFTPRAELREFLTANISMILFNKIGAQYKSDYIKLGGLVTEVVAKISRQNLDDFIPWLSPLYYSDNKILESSIKELNEYFGKEYDEHLSNLDIDNPKDILDLLITMTNGQDRENVIQIVFDLFTGGSDTSRAVIEWMCLFLINNPEIQTNAYNELISVVDKDCTFVDIKYKKKCPYILAIMKESLRIRPLLTLGPPYTVNEDKVVNDVFFPKGCLININIFEISNNPKYFEEPNKFLPERWINNDSFDDNNSFPFSLGKRTCIGQNFNEVVVFLLISNLILNFEIESMDGNKLDESEVFGLVIDPIIYSMKLKQKSKQKIN